MNCAVTGSSVFKVALASGQSFTDAFWNSNHTWSDIFITGSGKILSWAAVPEPTGAIPGCLWAPECCVAGGGFSDETAPHVFRLLS